MDEQGWTLEDVINGLHRISKKDIQNLKDTGTTAKGDAELTSLSSQPKERVLDRQKMSSLRKKLSARLVAVKQETAMLTTFNEVDMSRIMKGTKTDGLV